LVDDLFANFIFFYGVAVVYSSDIGARMLL